LPSAAVKSSVPSCASCVMVRGLAVGSSPGMLAVDQFVPLVKVAPRPYFVASLMISFTSCVRSGEPYQ
jgi:hypothetical protein